MNTFKNVNACTVKVAPEYICKMDVNLRSQSADDRFFLQVYIPQEDGKAKIGDVLYIGTAEKCREILNQINAGVLLPQEVRNSFLKNLK